MMRISSAILFFVLSGVSGAMADSKGMVQKVYGDPVPLLDKNENMTAQTIAASMLLNRPVSGRLDRGAWVVETANGPVIVDAANIRTNADPNVCVQVVTRQDGSQVLGLNGLSKSCKR